jgi:hypothetical protein
MRSARAVVHTPAALRGGDGQTDGRVRLPDAGRSEKDHVFTALYEAELVQALDLLATHRRLKREVEIAEQLHARQPTGTHGSLQPTIVSELYLSREERLERLRRRYGASVDTLKDGIECLSAPGIFRSARTQPVTA